MRLSEASFEKQLENKLNLNKSILVSNFFILSGILFLVIFVIQFFISNNDYKNQSVQSHF